jgi:hypothetical protein
VLFDAKRVQPAPTARIIAPPHILAHKWAWAICTNLSDCTHIMYNSSLLLTLSRGNTPVTRQLLIQESKSFGCCDRIWLGHDAYGHKMPMTKKPRLQSDRWV